MERHPAGCDPSSFRSLPTPSRTQSTRTNIRLPSLPTLSHREQYQELLDVPDIPTALDTLELVASDVVQPVTMYNRYTYLNRFNTAALKLADAFIGHLNQLRRRKLQHRRKSLPRHTHQALPSKYSSTLSDQSSDDGDAIVRKKSSRLARKRPRSLYVSSDDDDNYLPEAHRKSLPRRSKEIRTNLNDDLAYSLMQRMPPSPERSQHLKRLKPTTAAEHLQSSSSSSSEEDDDDDIAMLRVVRPLPFVRRRPLASDNSSLTPFVEQDDDSTDTEKHRRDHARLSLKTVIYGPGKAEFTEKEILTVFPARSKRRMKADRFMRTSQRPSSGDGTMPSSIPWQPTMSKLCAIPKEMYARYINGSYWLSQDTGIDGLHATNGLPNAPTENSILPKQILPSSDRETRDGDSGKASPATYVQSGSSTTGSPRAKKPEMQNGHMDIELGPSLLSLNHTQRVELKGGKNSAVMQRKNGKIHQSEKLQFQAWKDLAPYGRGSQSPQHLAQALEHKKLELSNAPGSTIRIQSTSNQNVSLIPQKKQLTPGNASGFRDNLMEITLKPIQRLKAHSQNQKLAQASSAQKLEPTTKSKPPKTDPPKTDPPKTEPPKMEWPKTEPPRMEQLQNGLESQKESSAPVRPSQALVKFSQPVSSSCPSNQMTIIARGAGLPPLGLHHAQMDIQPQLSLQSQAILLPAVPLQLAAHQAGLAAQHAIQLQQYSQGPRMLSQWQLQNPAVQQVPGAMQLPPGYTDVNSIVTQVPPIPTQGTFATVQPVLTAANGMVTAETTVRPEAVSMQANGVVAPATAEPAQLNDSSTTSPPSKHPENFNSQLREQYRKHYEQNYSKSYHESMMSLKQELGQDGTP